MTGLATLAPGAAIDKCTARLAVAFQRQIDAATMRIYRETMSDLPLWAIEGAELVLRRKGGTFFPSAASWHQAAEALVVDRQRESLTQPASDALYECETCRDQGWAAVTRGDGSEAFLICSCRPTNSRYQRMQVGGRKRLQE